MAVNLSPVGGVAAQFFTSTGAVLTGGKLYTYAAGTTTPAVTYTSSNGATAWTNPVVLDAAGRVPGSGEIWLTDGIIYKFVLKDSNDVLIATYDNITGINSNSVSYTNQQEIVTATAGQTVFNLGISYQPATNSLSVFVDGVNQYGPGALYSYIETDSNTVTFNSGLHVGAEVKFTTTQQQGAGAVDASQVTYDPPFTGGVATNVEAKLAQYVSVKDFGAIGDGVTDDTSALQAFLDACKNKSGFITSGTYKITSELTLDPQYSYNIEGECWSNSNAGGGAVVIYNAGTGNAIRINNSPYTQNYDKQIRLANFTVEGTASSQHGIYVTQTPVFFENLWITGNGFHGLFLEKAYGSSFKQIICTQNYRHGCYVYGQNNAVYFDHCVFNGNSRTDGYSGVGLSASGAGYENLGVAFTSCDFTGNGATVTNAYGLSIQYSQGVTMTGCYMEGNKLRNLYADSSCAGLSVIGSYFQDGTNELVSLPSLTYQNNQHTRVSSVTNLTILNTQRTDFQLSGNAFAGGATSTLTYTKQRAEFFDNAAPVSGTWVQGDLVWYNTVGTGYPVGYVCTASGTPGTWQPFGQAGYRNISASPIGVVTPIFLGEEILDTVNVKWYKSTGLTNSSWVALN